MREISITKRDGTKVPYDASKIKASIKFATDDLNINPLELESKIDIFIKNGMSTHDIQENVIQHAIQLASPIAPDWTIAAGRAFAMQEWASFKLRDKSFLEIVKYNIAKKEYTKELLKFYSDADITTLGEYIKYDRDLTHTHSSLMTARSKYLGKFELNQHMHMVTAMRFGQLEDKSTRIGFVKEAYDSLSNRELSLATPFMSNLRSGGNIASCFIVSIDDDLESIYDVIKDIAMISKNGGGLGINLGRLRAKGSSVKGRSGSAGSVVQWVKVINDTLVAVNQSFAGDTLIDCKDGTVPIKCITEGDMVKTHDGSFKEVVGVRSRVSTDKIFRVNTSCGSVVATGGHPVLVVKRGEYGVDELKQKLRSGEIKPEWVDIDELTSEHFVIKSR